MGASGTNASGPPLASGGEILAADLLLALRQAERQAGFERGEQPVGHATPRHGVLPGELQAAARSLRRAGDAFPHRCHTLSQDFHNH